MEKATGKKGKRKITFLLSTPHLWVLWAPMVHCAPSLTVDTSNNKSQIKNRVKQPQKTEHVHACRKTRKQETEHLQRPVLLHNVPSARLFRNAQMGLTTRPVLSRLWHHNTVNSVQDISCTAWLYNWTLFHIFWVPSSVAPPEWDRVAGCFERLGKITSALQTVIRKTLTEKAGRVRRSSSMTGG